MKCESMLEEVITNIVKLAAESQEHLKCLEKLKLLSESETYEELLALALIENAQRYVKPVNTVSELIHRHSYCQFLGSVFKHASENPKKFLRLQAAIMKIVLSWDCNLRDGSNNLEESVECDAECLTFLLPILGPKLEETFASQLEMLFYNIRTSTLAEHLPKMLRGKLLDLLLLKASGWKTKVGIDIFNFGLPFVSGNLPVMESGKTLSQPVSLPESKDYENIQQPPKTSRKEAILLTPSEFEHHEEIPETGPPRSIDYSKLNPVPSNYSPLYAQVESLTTLQKSAPRASTHPKPPISWRTSDDYQNGVPNEINPEPELFYTYVPFRASQSPAENTGFSATSGAATLPARRTPDFSAISGAAKLPTRRTPTVASYLREDLPNYNGARPRTKPAFHSNESLGENESCLRSKITSTSTVVPHSSPVQLETEMRVRNSFESAEPVGLCKEDVERCDSPHRPKVSLKGIEKVNHFLRSNPNPKEQVSNSKSTPGSTDSSSDDADIIVEEPPKKTAGTKKKTKWTPLRTATPPVKAFPFKQEPVRRPQEVVRTVLDPTEHPFFKSSQRYCTICGETDHMTSACRKPIASCFPKDF